MNYSKNLPILFKVAICKEFEDGCVYFLVSCPGNEGNRHLLSSKGQSNHFEEFFSLLELYFLTEMHETRHSACILILPFLPVIMDVHSGAAQKIKYQHLPGFVIDDIFCCLIVIYRRLSWGTFWKCHVHDQCGLKRRIKR